MKAKFQTFAVLLIAALTTLFAQGPLTPPGAPAPTMKTLQQVEPRTPITSMPATISESGSYYLTANAVGAGAGAAVTIAADHVTLDLNGFTIVTPATNGTGTGILLSGGRRNIAISNGHIVGDALSTNGFLHGINWSTSAPRNVRVTDLSVSGCGMHGIQLGDDGSTVVERCTVDLVGAEGIRAGVVNHSTATRCGGIAIVGKTASHCYGQSTSGTGLSAFSAENCYGAGGGSGDGVSAETSLNCYGVSGSGIGVIARAAENCYGASNGSFGFGVSANSAQNCYGNNSGGGYGVKAFTAQNCFGNSNSGIGVFADVAHNCEGLSSTGTGVRFSFIGAMCFGERITPFARDYVIGVGLAGPVNLP